MAKHKSGFTIVELLIVIVVIAILAAITIVAYNGIQNKANDTAIVGDLRSVLGKAQQYNASEGLWPTSSNLTQLTIKASKSSYATSPTTDYNLTLCFHTTGSQFGVIALSKSGRIFQGNSSTGNVTELTGSAWPGNSGAACALFLTTNTNYNGYNASDTSTGPWRAWAGGN